ncbi:MAG: SPFH domain-containing protein [Acidaminococcaceae bacterium]|nr:SPFH domain-containing protein [Acidaminococcaceae bacterium]
MGLIKAGMGAIGGVLADQWKEYFYCDSTTPDVLMCKGQKRTSSQGRSSNTSGEDNIISNGSVIAVNVGQCMMIVEQGKVVDLCAEPGEYTYDKSTEPSVFTGDLKESVIQVFQRMGKRFTFGGDTGKDQRVYYFNTKEIIGNKYGTPAEIPFKVIEENTGRSLLVRIRCFGEYSYKIVDPILFYSTIAGNAPDQYLRSQWDSQLKSELLTALQPAFGKISAQRIDYTELPMRTMELADALNDVLSSKWRDLRGIEIVSFGVNSVKANEEDEAKLQKVQMGAMMSNPEMRMGVLTDATADGIRNASANESGMGPMGAFIGMGMANMAGGMAMGNAYGPGGQYPSQYGQQPYGQPPQQPYPPQQPAPAAAPAAAAGWACSCGHTGNTGNFCSSCGKPKPAPQPAAGGWDCACGAKGNTGKFCTNCGKPQPAAPEGWTCSCGSVNQGQFCPNCGSRKPAGAPLYKCDKCGWEPEDPHNPPKFCPRCGDPFNEGDIVK